MDAAQIINAYAFVEAFLFMAIGLAGLAGAVLAATTRPDAFDAGGRQSKVVWILLLVVSSFVVMTGFPFLSWIGMVIIGVYWFDVRPQLQDILHGNYGW